MRPIVLAVALVTAFAPVHAQSFDEFLARADSLYEQGDYTASGRAYERAFVLQDGKATQYYNAACSWALAGEGDRAFAMLDAALDKGHHDAELLLGDTDLESLRGDPRWDAIVVKYREAEEAYLSTVNRELYNLFQADQADRHGEVDWKVVSPRDAARRARVQEMIDEGLLEARDDFVHAAFIFQHGADSTSYRIAHELAMTAVALDSTYMGARWIAAAAKDRYLHSVGLPQIYGTQLHMVNGAWTLSPFDTTAVTDAERARWGVPPLARQRAWERQMNARMRRDQ